MTIVQLLYTGIHQYKVSSFIGSVNKFNFGNLQTDVIARLCQSYCPFHSCQTVFLYFCIDSFDYTRACTTGNKSVQHVLKLPALILVTLTLGC